MFVVAINGSPRKNGRLSQLIEEIMTGAKGNDHIVKTINLVDLDIKDCRGCMQCQRQGHCVMRDDIETIESSIEEADVIIWASPTHWGNVSAITLRVFERLFGFLIEEMPRGLPRKRSANGKKAILITTCSTPFPFNWLFNQSRSTINRMREVCKYSGQEIVATLVLPGTLGMKEIPARLLARAKKVGEGL